MKIVNLPLIVFCVLLWGCQASSPAMAPAVAGEWMMTVDTPVGQQHLLMTLKQDGANVSGEVSNVDSPHLFLPLAGSIHGSDLIFHYSVPMGDGESMRIECTAEVASDAMNGNAKFEGAGLTGELVFIANRR